MVDYLTHFYRRGSPPFRSLSALPDSEALPLMRALCVDGSIMWERFKDPDQYLQARRETECWLREAFVAKGGRPQESYPIYMILGSSRWAARVADPATLAVSAELRVPLAIFEECDLSFTYPDSMISSWFGRDKPVEYYQPEYHGRVFTLAEIHSIVECKGLPEEGWQTTMPGHLAHYIEAQVWNRQPLLKYARTLEAKTTQSNA
jgi:hypothetical protein